MRTEDLVSRGIPEKIANFLLSHFQGDVERIYMVLNSLKKDIPVVKLKFSFSLYSGIALVFVNLKAKKVDLVRAYISVSPEITKINIEMNWFDIISKVSSEYRTLQIDPDLSAKAEKLLLSDAKFVQTLIKVLSEDKTQLDIKRFLYTYVPLVFGDPNTIVRFSIDRTDVFNFYKFLKDAKIEMPESLRFLDDEKALTTISISDISIQPILSPIDGITAGSIRAGNEIYVKINDTDEVSRSFVKGDGITLGRVVAVQELENDRLLFDVEIGPGFLGSFIIKKDVKIRTKSVILPEKVDTTYVSLDIQKTPPQDYSDRSQFEEDTVEREKDVSMVFWIVNILLIGVGVATVLILLLFL
ncbi:MAG: hypothetical protein RMJ37_03640 [Spirochaetia bacterium]|nr:hypothetical protein [Spirochaetota bacterium]MCX8096938.1 hypothetical protein [Spirochaetota bacterium]MDW8112421.1 hypothetical protein [Spirochaetia bacterium]